MWDFRIRDRQKLNEVILPMEMCSTFLFAKVTIKHFAGLQNNYKNIMT